MKKKENDDITASISQNQDAKKGSISTQIGVQNNYTGLTPEQACSIALDLFRDNFPALQREALNTVNERVEVFINEFIRDLSVSGITNFEFMKDPDVQNALFESEKGYALKGGDDLRITLVKLLKNRCLGNTENILSTILNEAIKTAPLLNEKQKDLLAIRFLIGETKTSNIKDVNDLIVYLKSLIPAFTGINLLTRTDIRHLDYCKCCHELIGKDFGCSIAITYKEILPITKMPATKPLDSGSIKLEIADRVLDIQTFLQEKCPELDKIMIAYNGIIRHMMITSVGLVIGAIHAEIKLSKNYDLRLWIN